jgi:DNA polymerase-3 subunit chi
MDDVLVNLGDEVPGGFDRFKRLIEVVSSDDHGKAQARLRWKHYKSLGYELLQHDLSKPSEP